MPIDFYSVETVVNIPPQDYLINQILPEGVNLLSAHPKQGPDTNKPDTDEADASKAKAAPAPAPSAPQKEANITAPPANNNGTVKGAQPVVPAGSFDNRFGSFQ